MIKTESILEQICPNCKHIFQAKKNELLCRGCATLKKCHLCLTLFETKLINLNTQIDNICHHCLQQHRAEIMKTKAMLLLGGKCHHCGWNKCTTGLEFHHNKNKQFNISHSYYKNWVELEDELKKCTLLCANCHRETHFNDINQKKYIQIQNVLMNI